MPIFNTATLKVGAAAVQSAYLGGVSVYSSGTALPNQAGIVAHWSSDSLAQADGSAVTSWTDSVGGAVASQGTPASQPTFKTNIYNSKPSIRFDGTGDKLAIAATPALISALNSQTFTVLIAFQQRGKTAGGGYGSLFSYKNTAAATFYYIADSKDGTDAANRLHRYSMIGANAHMAFPFNTYGNTLCTFGNTSGVGGVLGLAALERAYINGSCVCSDTIKAPAGHATTPDMMIGSSVASNFPVNADIFEVVIWNAELTPPQVAQFHGWVCEKYAQTKPWASVPYFTVFDGDSITAGVMDTNSPRAETYPYKAAQTLGLTYGQWTNTGIGYQTMPQMTTKFATDVNPLSATTQKPLKIAAFEWYNQRAASPTPRNNSLAYLSAVRAAGAKVCFGTSTDTLVTSDANRADYNSYFDANNGTDLMDSYVAIHTNAQIGLETAHATYPANYSADGLHLSAAGYTVLASLMASGLAAIT